MNTVAQEYYCATFNYHTYSDNLYRKHYMTEKVHAATKNDLEKSQKYLCKECNYNTDKRSDYLKHIFTPKHLLRQNVNKKSMSTCYSIQNTCIDNGNAICKNNTNISNTTQNSSPFVSKYICASCKKVYKHQSSLSRHMKTCTVIQNTKSELQCHETNNTLVITPDNKETQCYKKQCQYCAKTYKYASGLSRHMRNCEKKLAYINNHNTGSEKDMTDDTTTTDNKNMLLNISNSTSSTKDTSVQDILMKCFEMMTEQTQTINKLIPNIGNNNNNNTTNNKFNLNVYLNETCKDAINLPEFVSNITLQLADLLSARKNGLLSSTTNVFLKELQSTEPVRRPIQCTDVKRKTMYIKEAGAWSKDIGNEKLKKAMTSISQKHMHLINDWKHENPKHMESDDGQEEFVKVIQSATKDIEHDTRSLQSAVKEIGGFVHIAQPEE
jgi:hypothetical protein